MNYLKNVVCTFIKFSSTLNLSFTVIIISEICKKQRRCLLFNDFNLSMYASHCWPLILVMENLKGSL